MYPYKITSKSKLNSNIPEAVNNTQDSENNYIYQGFSAKEVKPLNVYYLRHMVGTIEPDAPCKLAKGIHEPLDLIPRIDWAISTPVDHKGEDFNVDKLISEPGEEDDYILNGVQRGDVTSLAATGGTGKGMILIKELAKLALGESCFFSHNKEKRKVFYLSVEDRLNTFRKRFKNLHRQENFSKEARATLRDNFKGHVAKNLVIADKEGQYAPRLIDTIGTFTPDLLIIDTARRTHRLNENDSTEMTEFVDLLEEIAESLDCAILLVHHTSKASNFATAQGADIGTGATRGSSVLIDNARAAWYMYKLPKGKAKELEILEADRKNYVVLEQSKCNDVMPMPDFILKRDQFGFFHKYEKPLGFLNDVKEKKPKIKSGRFA